MKALLSIPLAPNSSYALTMALVLFDSAEKLMQTSVQMPRRNAGVPKEEPNTASKSNCLEEIVRVNETKERNKMENQRFENRQVDSGGTFVGER